MFTISLDYNLKYPLNTYNPKMCAIRRLALCLMLPLLLLVSARDKLEEEHGVKYADRCEACKILAIELQGRLTETGRSHDVIEVG